MASFSHSLPLASTVRYLMGEICPGAGTGFLLGGVYCTLVDGTEIFFSSDGHAVGCLWTSWLVGQLVGDKCSSCLVAGELHVYWRPLDIFTISPMSPFNPPKVPFVLSDLAIMRRLFWVWESLLYHKAFARVLVLSLIPLTLFFFLSSYLVYKGIFPYP